MSEKATKNSAARKAPVKVKETSARTQKASGKRAAPRTGANQAGPRSARKGARPAKPEKRADALNFEAKAKDNGKAAVASKAKPGEKAAVASKAKSGVKTAASTAKSRSTRVRVGASTGKNRSPAKDKASRTAAPKRGRGKSPRRGTTAAKARSNPVGEAANRRNAQAASRKGGDDLFLERSAAPATARSGGTPPERHTALFGALNACLAIAIAVLAALGLRVHSQYGEFLAMRDVVDKQTFYEGTTVEGVDVSKMTLSNALDYWRDRVEARNASRTVRLDDGTTITAGELGYTSDYASVLTTAWSHGRSGTLEERYAMASSRMQNPAAYAIHRTQYSDALVDQFVQMQALKIDRESVDASVADFNVETYEFTFNPSSTGLQLDTDALRRDVISALEAGGGDVTLSVAEQPPEISTEQISEMYGLIDYAITNANASSKSRLNNITLAMSMINGTKLAPGETFSFNGTVGQRTSGRGFKMATAYSGGEVTEQVGGGICQVSTTLFNAAVKADMRIDERHNHSLTVHYVDKGKDATVDWGNQDLKFTNTSADDIYICCYLTDDKRVRFGIFGRLLPDGEKITLDAVTVKVNKFETEYQPDPSLPHGKLAVAQNGRDGYKAEAYKVRWDAAGNELSRELLCTSIYKTKNEIILYGA